MGELIRETIRVKIKLLESTRDFYIHNNNRVQAELNCFVHRTADLTSSYEQDLGQETRALEGFLFSVKDNILTKDFPTTACSKILSGFTSNEDAFCVEILKKHGAVLVGKTNMDEFGMGSFNQNSPHGPCKNPKYPELVSGGSSGGAAASVASGLVSFAVASDTGGSVRLPAAYCDLYGYKPTFGSVSKRGLIAYASSLDQVGIITSSLGDTQILRELLQVRDPFDSYSFGEDQVAACKWPRAGVNPKFVYPRGALLDLMDRREFERFDAALREFQSKSGLNVIESNFSDLSIAAQVYYVIATAEASSNLARYDGIRFGNPNGQPSPQFRAQNFGKEVLKRILVGTFVLSQENYRSYFEKACRLRGRIFHNLRETLRDADGMILPVFQNPPKNRFEDLDLTPSEYRADAVNVIANLTGTPAVSIPLTTYLTEKSLPMSMQIVGNWGTDKELIQFLLGQVSR